MSAAARLLVLAVVLALAAAAPASAATLYLANSASNDLSALTIGPGGDLVPVPGSPFPGGTGNRSLAFTPDARMLYVVTNPGGSVDAPVLADEVRAGGVLDPTFGGRLAERNPAGSAVSPDGRFLYVTNSNSGTRNFNGYAIGAGGALSELPGSPYALDVSSSPTGIAITPDGRLLYVIGSGNVLYGFARGADGVPVLLSGFPATGNVGSGPGIAVSPRGDFLFTTDTGGDSVRAFRIAADGTLTANPQGPVSSGGDNPSTPAVSPDGRFLYVPNRGGTGTVGGLQVAADGTLSELPGSPYALATPAVAAAVSADGRYLYAAASGGGNDLFAFALAADGGATPLAGSPFASGGNSSASVFSLGGLRVAPDQGPIAALSASPLAPDGTARFDASGSHDPDGAVTRYDWSFGDGTTLANGGPTPTHRYAQAGAHTASVTVGDAEGCVATPIYTGQSALCTPSGAATASVAVAPPGFGSRPAISKLATGAWRKGRARVRFTLSAGARVRVTVERPAVGRKLKGHCRKPTRANRARPRCTRYVAVGRRTLAGKAGRNSFTLGPKVGGHALTPGAYRLSLVATDLFGRKSAAKRDTFTLPAERRHR
jgi:DNA-binding beta-propeller fold protein YncE